MRLVLQIGGLLLACSAAFAADQRNAAANPPASRPAPLVRQPAPPAPKGGPPKQPKIGPPLSNPMSPAARLYRANSEQRERALEKLPEKMQEQLRAQLDAFDKLPREEQEVRIKQADRFSALTPERKTDIRRQMQALGKLEKERRVAVVLALRRLYVLPPADRQRVMASDDFKSRFSADEQKMIADLSEVFLPPV